MQTRLYLLPLFLFTILCTCVRAQTFDLTLNTGNSNAMTITEPTPGTYDIMTTGNDPWVTVNPFMPGPYDPEAVYVISFEYSATNGLDDLEIFYGAVNAARKASWTDLYATDAGVFRTFKAFMTIEVDNWNSPFQALRFDISKIAGANITMRNIQLREPTDTEIIPLVLDPLNINANATTVTADGNGGYDFVTSGADPWIATETISPGTYDPNLAYVVTYDYMGTDDLDDFRIFFGEPWSGARQSLFGPLAAAPTGASFTGLMPLSDEDWYVEPWNKLRFDFGRQPNKTININNFVLREATHEESKALLPPEIVEFICIELNTGVTSPFLTATEPLPGTYDLVTDGPDPWIVSVPTTETYDINETYILSFEYQAQSDYNELQIFFKENGPPGFGTDRAMTVDGLPAAADWTERVINPRLFIDNFQDAMWTQFRFDVGRNEPDPNNLLIRNLKLRKPTAQELADEQNSDKFVSLALNAEFLDYLDETFDQAITEVETTFDKVIVKGTLDGAGPFWLGEILPSEYGFNKLSFPGAIALTDDNGTFEIELDRLDPRADRDYDRIYSRWVVLDNQSGNFYSQASAANWTTCMPFATINNLEEDKAPDVKGLDGLTPATLPEIGDLTDLGVTSMKINLLLNGVFSLGGGGGGSHTFNGKTYGINQNFVDNLDARIQACTARDIKVAFVLLIPLGIGNQDLRRIFLHPDASLGLFSMANVTSEEGVEHYAAMVDFLSERYSRPDQAFGRVDQWIIHNEVDAHTSWTHAGQKPAELYTQIYDRSMRVVHYTIRKHNPTAKVFTSFTKHWNSKVGGANGPNFRSNQILSVLTGLVDKEGDYEWGIGWHSYPTNLNDPRVWNDNPAVTPLALNAQQITPRNLEMIDAYARQITSLYNGKKVRTVLLSENGFSSNTDINPAYTEQNMAAAVAYFWKKTAGRLPSIESIHYHRWVDNTMEGNLLFGLRRNVPGTVQDFGAKKPAWDVWEAAGTSSENAVFNPYLSTVGINSWSDIQFNVSTDVTPYPVTMNITNCDGDEDQLLVSFNGEKRFPQADGTVRFYNVASNVDQPYEIMEDGVVIESGMLVVNQELNVDINTCALPVEWLSFTAQARAKDVVLSWENTPEEANAGFTVERSADGRNWETIGQVRPRPVTAPQRYELVDESPLSGDGYYRVTQTDFDGQFTISPVRRVWFGNETGGLTVSPNPTRGTIQLELPGGFEIDRLELIDPLGRVSELKFDDTRRVLLPAGTTGTCVMRAVATDGTVLTGKVMVQ